MRIVHLYPTEMNIYGDSGNVLTLVRRLRWHGYPSEVVAHHVGDELDPGCDLLVGGGGQDSGQALVEEDLSRQLGVLHRLADDGVPMLVVCGLFQMFGRTFHLADGRRLQGIGIFAAHTVAGRKRLIGNVTAESSSGDGTLVGYENHSGRTFLDPGQRPLGRIRRGAGNNGEDKTEGAVYRHVRGTYLHGSVLPKNPVLADRMIAEAVVRRYGEFHPGVVDDAMAHRARAVAAGRPR